MPELKSEKYYRKFYIVIRGPLGCGKSTIAKKLSEILDAKYFSFDEILEVNNLTIGKEDGYIAQKSFIKANKIAIKASKKFLQENKPIIFEGNFYWKSQIDDLISYFEFPYFVFTLKASLKTCIKRDNERKLSYGVDAVKVVYKKTTEFDCGIKIDADKNLYKCIAKIISYLPKIEE